MNCSTPGLPVHHQLPEFTQTHVHRVGDAIQPSHPLSSPSPPAPNPFQHQCLSNESALRIRWPKYWSLSFGISPSNEHPGLTSFRMDWLDLLAVQGTLKSLHQHHSSRASVLRHSAFFTVQFSHPYMTTGKTITLTRRTFVGRAMSLLFNMLSRLVITFLPRSKCLLISWLQSPSAVVLDPNQIKSDTVSTVSPSICHEVVGPDAMILVFWMLSFKPTFCLSSFTFIKRLFSSSSLSAITVVSSAFLRWLIFLPAILIPACASSSPAFLVIYLFIIKLLTYISDVSCTGRLFLYHLHLGSPIGLMSLLLVICRFQEVCDFPWYCVCVCVCVCVCSDGKEYTGTHTHMPCMHFMQFMKHNPNDDLSKS